MPKPVEIRSSTNKDGALSIPAENVSEVAEALRARAGVPPETDERSDEEIVAQELMEYARQTVLEYRRIKKLQEADQQARQEAENAPF